MTPTKTPERLALAGLIAGLAYTALAVILGQSFASYSLFAVAAAAGMTSLVAALTMAHAILRRQAMEEVRDLAGSGDDSSLFDGDSGSQIKQRNLRQFERIFVPAVTIVLALAELVIGVWLFRQAAAGELTPVEESARTSAAVVFVAGVVLFLLGSYLAGLAFRGEEGTLRALAAELVALAWISGIVGIVVLLELTELPSYDALLAKLIAVCLLLRAVEKVLTVVMEIYRPRRRRTMEHLVYESRLNGLVAQPRSLAANLAETLHYQFGVKVAETHLSQWLSGVGLLIFFHVLVLGALSCVVFVNAGEQLVLERWGRPRSQVLGPGVHAKLPWPAERAYRCRVDTVHELVIGRDAAEPATAMLWTDTAATELETFLAASETGSEAENPSRENSLNLVAAAVIVQYQISDVRNFLYTCRDPERQLTIIARREIVRRLASQDLTAIMQTGRRGADEELRRQIQSAAARRQLGVKIQYVGFRYLQPPPPIVPAFHDVTAAAEDSKRAQLNAQDKRQALLTSAQTRSEQVLSAAQSYKDGRIKLAKAEAASYRQLLSLYKKHRKIYRARAYLQRIEKLRDVRKLVLATDVEDQVINLDLKKSKAELFDFAEDQP